MPVSDLLGEVVAIQFNPDAQAGAMGGPKDDWQPVAGKESVRVSLREQNPTETDLAVAASREYVERTFTARFDTPQDLNSQHRLVWDDPVTGRVRYLKVEGPPRHGRHAGQWVAVVTEMAQ